MADQYDEQALKLCGCMACLQPLRDRPCSSATNIAAALRELGEERDALSKALCDMSDGLLEAERERDDVAEVARVTGECLAEVERDRDEWQRKALFDRAPWIDLVERSKEQGSRAGRLEALLGSIYSAHKSQLPQALAMLLDSIPKELGE